MISSDIKLFLLKQDLTMAQFVVRDLEEAV